MITLGKSRKGARRKSSKRASTKLDFVVLWIRRFGFALSCLVALIWLGTWFYVSGAARSTYDFTTEKAMQISADLGFRVENILVEGRVNTDADVLLGLVNVQKGDPIFSFNPHQAYDLISQIAWVEDVSVRRQLPNTIYIELQELQPLALYNRSGKAVLIDTYGTALTDYRLDRFSKLVMVSGNGAPENALELIQNLKAEDGLYERIKLARFIEGRRWNLQTQSNVIIKLPHSDIGLSLRRLMMAHEDAKILDQSLDHIDLRKKDRIIIQAPNSSERSFNHQNVNHKI